MREGGTSVRSKARFVDPIVDVVICPVICPFDFISQLLGEKVNTLIPSGEYVIKFCVEHADDFAGLNVDTISSRFRFRRVETDLIADYLVLFDVIKRWYSETPCVVGINVEVNVSKMGKVLVYWVRCDIVSRHFLFWACKAPPFHGQQLALLSPS